MSTSNNQKIIKNSKEELQFTQIEKEGLNYIKNHRNYLIVSSIFPIYLILIQVLNFIFILRLEAQKPSSGSDSPTLLDVLTPIIIMFIIGIFSLIVFLFLFSWKKKVLKYKNQQISLDNFSFSEPDTTFPEHNIPLTKLFYDIIDNMRILKLTFIGLNIICAYYLIWFVGFFFIRPPLPLPRPPLHYIVQWLNIFSQIGLLFYLIFEWRHFYRWNKKLKELKEFERKIYLEIFQSKK